jgi:ATP-dependent RNA helicase DeaD
LKEFKEMNLRHELLEALRSMGFNQMTEVQELSIPILLQHKDLIVRSKTGSGKTGAFLIPIVHSIEPKGHPQALIVLPTRELAVQVSTVAQKLTFKGGLRIAVVYGGASINMQIQKLRNADIVIGTPGRIIDLMDRGALRTERVKFMVLDEADLMLDMGFIEDVETIIARTPKDRQTMLFSATMPEEIVGIAKKHMRHDAVKLTVGEEEQLTVSTITHTYFVANGRNKFAALMAYIEKFEPKKCIIFTSTQRESEYVHRFLALNGFDAILMHGGLTQAKREHSLREFRERARFLISTNLASRGLDIPDISDIINFDAPDDPKIYVHRVGRSARMGKNGRAFTIFGVDQGELMEATGRVANVQIKRIDLDTLKFKDIQLPQQGGRRGPPRGGFQRQGGGRYQRSSGGYPPRRDNYSRGRSGGNSFSRDKVNRHEYGGASQS